MDLSRLDELVPLLDPTALPRVIGRDEAIRRGYTSDAIAHRVARGRWQRVLPRTYLTSDTFLNEDRLRAALTFAGPESLLSGAAALRDLSVRGVPEPMDARILVLVPTTIWCRSSGFVRVRRTTRRLERAALPGPRRVAVARAVADLSLELTRLDDVRTLVTEVVRRRLCTADGISAELARSPRRGSAHLRRALDDVRGGAWSAPEARAAHILTRAGAPDFEQNAVLQLPHRTVVVDFLWRRLRAVLEIDSDTHHALTGDARRTAGRHQALETAGFSVVHHTPRFVHDEPEEFARGVLAWLAARAIELGDATR